MTDDENQDGTTVEFFFGAISQDPRATLISLFYATLEAIIVDKIKLEIDSLNLTLDDNRIERKK